MILSACHRLDRLTVYKGKDRYLTSGHELLDDHLISCCAEFLVQHDRFHALFSLFEILTYEYAFAECKSVSLQNDRELCLLQILQSLIGICKVLICCCRNIILFHQIF